MELVEPVQMKLYESNTYRKDLSWLHFDDKSRVQDGQQVKENSVMKSKYFCRAFQLNNKAFACFSCNKFCCLGNLNYFVLQTSAKAISEK